MATSLVNRPGASARKNGVVLDGRELSDDTARLRRALRRIRRRITPGSTLVVRHVEEGRATGLGARLREAGFAVEPQAGGELVAHPLPVPPSALGVASWGTPGGVKLDLRYASDEADLLDQDVRQLWEKTLGGAAHGGADIVANYAVDDSYGGVRAAPVLSSCFGCRFVADQVTFGAGVTALLHALSGLADGGRILVPELTHPDLEVWARTQGSDVQLLPGLITRDRLISELDRTRPTLLHCDRPDFLGQLLDLGELEEVVRAASRVGAIVLIDESAAQYLGPAGSAARLIERVENLVVLRGFTKAYSLGGLRAAYAVASRDVAEIVRELVPPLQVCELALHAALGLVRAGDIFGRLRTRVRTVKPIARRVLEAAGVEVLANREEFPWVGVRDPGGATARFLESRGVFALHPSASSVFPGRSADVLRLTVPLSDDRMALFEELLS
jgi:histidinol-phosphate/aromatic aminotransferase/cobyric acid decarboxylase-like protein